MQKYRYDTMSCFDAELNCSKIFSNLCYIEALHALLLATDLVMRCIGKLALTFPSAHHWADEDLESDAADMQALK